MGWYVRLMYHEGLGLRKISMLLAILYRFVQGLLFDLGDMIGHEFVGTTCVSVKKRLLGLLYGLRLAILDREAGHVCI